MPPLISTAFRENPLTRAALGGKYYPLPKLLKNDKPIDVKLDSTSILHLILHRFDTTSKSFVEIRLSVFEKIAFL